jgi:hypothetical protein
MEKRNSRRHETNRPIVCTFFNSRDVDSFFDGKMKNYCDAGVYAEMQTRFKNGTVLLIRTTAAPGGSSGAEPEEGFRSISLVEVKWSKPVSAGGLEYYATGLKHLVL